MKQTFKKTLGALALVAAGLGVASTASANSFNLNSFSGPVITKFNGFTSNSTLFGSEDWFAAGNLSQIVQQSTPSNILFQTNSGSNAGVWVTFFMYGADSAYPSPTVANTSSQPVTGCSGGGGCDGNVYLDFYVNTQGPFDFSTNAATNRTSFNAFNGLTNAPTAELLARFSISTGSISFNNGFLGLTGSGADFAGQCIEGNACGGVGGLGVSYYGTGNGSTVNFNTNALPFGFDIIANFTLAYLQPDQATIGSNGWDLNMNDPALMNATTPEPGVLLMLGSALLGLAGVTRRRQRQI